MELYGDHTYCREFDFKSSNTLEKWFKTVEEAKECVEQFQTAFCVNFNPPVQKNFDCYKSRIFWNNETNVPYLIAGNEQQETPWQSYEDKKIRYVISMNKLVNFPAYQMTKQYRRKDVNKCIKQLVAQESQNLSMELAYSIKISKESSQDDDDELSQETKYPKFYSTYEEARNAVRQYEKETSTKYIRFAKTSFDTSKSLIRWDHSTLTPYILLRTNYYECHFGRDRNKVFNDKRLVKKFGVAPPKTRRTKPTKKKNCKAKVSIKEVIKFPQFKVLNSQNKTQIKKVRMGIRHAIATGDESLEKEYACIVYYPKISAHSGHVVKKFENEDLNRIEGVFNCFIGNTFEDFMKAKPYTNDQYYFTCKICCAKIDNFPAMNQHLAVHFSQCYFFSLALQEVSLLPCFGQCLGERRKRNHYHCPFCHEMSTNRITISSHVNAYKGDCVNNKDKPVPDTNNENVLSNDLDMLWNEEQPQWAVNQGLTYFVDQTFEEYIQQFSPESDCPLCSFQSSESDPLESHLYSAHLNQSVCFIYSQKNYCCLPCKRRCREKVDKHAHGHFHCPSCKRIIGSSSNFKQHIAATMGMCSEKPRRKEIPTTTELAIQDFETVELSADENDQYDFSSSINANFISPTDHMITNYEVVQATKQQTAVLTSKPDTNQYNCAVGTTGTSFRTSRPRKRKRKPKNAEESAAPLAEDTFVNILISEMRKVNGTKKRKIQEDLVKLVQGAAGTNEQTFSS